MKKDTEVKLYMQERRKGTSQRVAAARAGMSERTARKYEQAGNFPVISRLRMTGRPASIHLRKTGPGWSHSSNAIQRCKAKTCLPCSVSNILGAIDPHKSARCSVTSPGGERCMDPSRRSSLNNDTPRQSEHNRISPTWLIWVSPLQASLPAPDVSLCADVLQCRKRSASASAKPSRLWPRASRKHCGSLAASPATPHRSSQRRGASLATRRSRRLDDALRCAHGPLRHATDLEQYWGGS